MKLLLDTHTLLWWLADDVSLAPQPKEAIASPSSAVFVSAATAWEISIKQALGKLKAPSDLEHQIELNRFELLPITIGHAYSAGTLPRHHDDPFDRMLIAQALSEGMTIVTRDPRFRPYGVRVMTA